MTRRANQDHGSGHAIVPCWITSGMTQPVQDELAFVTLNTMVFARTPAGRRGEPEECARAAVCLASPTADFVTGIILPADGGYSVF